MPNRVIRETSRTSENLARLSAESERLFWRLITVADDYGRFQADACLVRASCFPRTIDTVSLDAVSNWLHMLADADLVALYEIAGQRYGVFKTWEKHQGAPRAKKSKYPGPPTDADTCKHLPADVRRCEQMPANVLVSESVSVSVSESDIEIRSLGPSGNSVPLRNGFDRFWAAYPKKADKQRAREIWNKLKPSAALQDQMLTAIERAKTSRQWIKDRGDYIPYPSTWLNKKRWEDEHGAKTGPSRYPSITEQLKEQPANA